MEGGAIEGECAPAKFKLADGVEGSVAEVQAAMVPARIVRAMAKQNQRGMNMDAPRFVRLRADAEAYPHLRQRANRLDGTQRDIARNGDGTGTRCYENGPGVVPGPWGLVLMNEVGGVYAVALALTRSSGSDRRRSTSMASMTYSAPLMFCSGRS